MVLLILDSFNLNAKDISGKKIKIHKQAIDTEI